MVKNHVSIKQLDYEQCEVWVNYHTWKSKANNLLVGRLLGKNSSTDAWKAIPIAFFEKYGGLTEVQLQHKEVRLKCIVILLRNARLL